MKIIDGKQKKEKFSMKHPKFESCPVCGKQIQSKAYMNSHMKNYHEGVPFTPNVIIKVEDGKAKTTFIEDGNDEQ